MPPKTKTKTNTNTGSSSSSTSTSSSSSSSFKPMVSVCTPTFNRRPFWPIIIQCFRNQTYPLEKMEWIIVDDGTDKIRDVLEKEAPDLLEKRIIKYFALEEKMTLGKKRNYMHSKIKGSMVVYMDDDDYYPPERVEHAVDTLRQNKQALCAGSSKMYIYFKHIHKMYSCGPYGPNHATAGTFAFKARLLDETKYDDQASLAEEKVFLKNYTVPFVQLDPMKTILVFSHNHNTFDKRRMLDDLKNAPPGAIQMIREAPDTRVVDFIRRPEEANILRFFLQQIDGLLADYYPGEAAMKPDVLKQTEAIEEQRRMMTYQMHQQQQLPAQHPSSQWPPFSSSSTSTLGPTNGVGQRPLTHFITIHQPGKPDRRLSPEETVIMFREQQEFVTMQQKKIAELESIIVQQQRLLLLNNASLVEVPKDASPLQGESLPKDASPLQGESLPKDASPARLSASLIEGASSASPLEKSTPENFIWVDANE